MSDTDYNTDDSGENTEEEYDDEEEEYEEEKFYVETIQVKPDLCMTSDVISEFEQVGVTAIRINQIMKYNNSLVANDGETNEVKIVEKELKQGKTPISIHRSVKKIENNKLVEYIEIVNLDGNNIIFTKK